MKSDDKRAKFDAVIAEIAATGRARAALRTQKLSNGTFWRMLASDAAKAEQYARAKELGMQAVAEELLDIADDSKVGETDKARLQVDTRKWLLARLVPKRYGDRTIIAGDAENPLAIEHTDAVGALLSRPVIADDETGTAGTDGETIQ